MYYLHDLYSAMLAQHSCLIILLPMSYDVYAKNINKNIGLWIPQTTEIGLLQSWPSTGLVLALVLRH